jgi:hypothetical protein
MQREQSLQHGIATAASLAFAGWLASQTRSKAPNLIMAKKSAGRRVRQTHAADGMSPQNAQDLRVVPLSLTNVPRRIPRNIPSLITWDVTKINRANLSFSTSVISQTNVAVQLNDNPEVAHWTALFDQWAIPQFSVIIRSNYAAGSTSPPGMMYTALDFDNVSNLSTTYALQDYGTAQQCLMTEGKTVVRSIRPSVKGMLQGAGGNATSAVEGPVWIDSGTPDVLHNGIRVLLGTCPGAYDVSIEVVITYCFRNNL